MTDTSKVRTTGAEADVAYSSTEKVEPQKYPTLKELLDSLPPDKRKAFEDTIVRKTRNFICTNDGCANPRQNGSSRCAPCSEKYRNGII